MSGKIHTKKRPEIGKTHECDCSHYEQVENIFEQSEHFEEFSFGAVLLMVFL